MKRKIFLALLLALLSFKSFAENPIDQYCGKIQYGYLYYGDLYTGPYGLFHKFQKPPTAAWVYYSIGFGGGQNYTLVCTPPPVENVDFDTNVIYLITISALMGLLFTYRNKIAWN